MLVFVLNEWQLLFNGCATPVDFTNDSERWLLEEVESDLRSGLATSHFRNEFDGIETIAVLAVTRNGCEVRPILASRRRGQISFWFFGRPLGPLER